MKHVIVGTAGHIDHGKTTLIRALTNIETDRLKEEKERGITIDLGFAYFDLPSGRRAGIVDVPGHERFVKNMLAGAGGIDLVILVIAADEGIMPQTMEHLHILSLLETRNGVVALTKIDMVDPEWLELVQEDTRDRLQGTFLEDAPIIPVSGVTRAGIPELIEAVDQLTAEIAPRDEHLPFRLPIDRVFSITGFGTVVTGTLLEGSVQAGDTAVVYPLNQETRIRSVQVHGDKVARAYAGQRVALNLVGVNKEDLSRGDVLAAPGLLRPTLMLDVRLELLADAAKPLENRQRVRLYTGASEVLCRVVLLDSEMLLPGETSLAQLRLEEPLALLSGDRFVIRSYSPMDTIGGGSVLDAHPRKRKRFKEEGIRELLARETGGDLQILNQTLLQYSDRLPGEEELFSLAGRPAEKLTPVLEQLLAEDQALVLSVDGRSYYLHSEYLARLVQRARKALEDYHRRFPLRAGMPREELRSRLARSLSSKQFGALLTMIAAEGELNVQGGAVALADFGVTFSGRSARLRDHILQRLQAEPHSPPDFDQLQEELQETPDQLNEVLNALQTQGALVRVSQSIAFSADIVRDAQEKVVSQVRAQGQITLADLRDQLQTSRKYALALLDYFDQQKVTVRKGDVRVLHPQYQG
ncbi:MAG: selenocysteine-specific translation elongation factor [Bacillota bacterium]|jgi:selenocysteine-specific elongation factor